MRVLALNRSLELTLCPMNKEIRGGNSRQLAKQLDLLDKPTAVLDRKGQFLFVNAPLCRLCGTEATSLVGKQTSWDLPTDSTPLAPILSAFAPPAAAREGVITTRKLTSPIAGCSATGQLFLPLMGEDNVVELMLVALGGWEEFQVQVAERDAQDSDAEQTLAELRCRWPKLDGLVPLLGSSSSIGLTMERAQLAIRSEANLLIHGPQNVGKSDLCQAIFVGRLEHRGLNPVTGQYFPIDLAVLDAELVAGMLEVFQGRLRADQPKVAQQLVLENLHEASDPSIDVLVNYLKSQQDLITAAAISRIGASDLVARNPNWQELVNRLTVHELELPGLSHRREDIAVLAQQFLASACRKADRAMLSISSEAMDLLEAFSWPRNLNQLSDTIKTAVQLSVLTKSIQASHLPVEVRSFLSSAEGDSSQSVEPISLDEVLLELEKTILRRALKLSPRNRAQVARWLDISRPRLLRRIEQLGLD